MFYTIIITDAQAIFKFDSFRAAAEKFHSEMAYAMNQNLHCTCVVMDRSGAVHKSEVFTPQPTEEE